MSRFFVLLTLCIFPLAGSATCWQVAGQRYGIDPVLLKAIAWKESSGWSNAVGPLLLDGNRAIGLMQINSIHLPELARLGIERRDLFDACLNSQVGARILFDCIKQFGAMWKAVGCYYTGPASKNLQAQRSYVRDVQRYYHAYMADEALAAARPDMLAPGD